MQALVSLHTAVVLSPLALFRCGFQGALLALELVLGNLALAKFCQLLTTERFPGKAFSLALRTSERASPSSSHSVHFPANRVHFVKSKSSQRRSAAQRKVLLL